MSGRRIRKPLSRGEKAISVVAYIVMGAFSLLAVLPFLHVLSKSVSDPSAVTAGAVRFWPVDVQLKTILFVLYETDFLHALRNTVIVAGAGTVISVLVTMTTAYPLSKPKLKGRKLFLLLYVFSMVFFGGIVPAYMVVHALGILDTFAALILPFVIVQFNMFIVKNYFEGLPESIEESAMIDGAGHLRILFSIVSPISKPILATVSLLYAVNYWNNYFHAMMYTKSPDMKTLQVYLYGVIYNGDAMIERLLVGKSENVAVEGLKAAAVMLSIVPIIALYPFIQRYLIVGITIGSVKG